MPTKTYKHTDIEVKIVPIKPEALQLSGCRGVVLYQKFRLLSRFLFLFLCQVSLKAFSIFTVVSGNNCPCREKSVPHSLSQLFDDLSAKRQPGRKLHDYHDSNAFFRQKKHRCMLFLFSKKMFSVVKRPCPFDFYYSLQFECVCFHSHPYKKNVLLLFPGDNPVSRNFNNIQINLLGCVIL